jgi:hypothetical protein
MRGVRFRETMTGRVALHACDPVAGFASVSAYAASMHASIEINDVAEFVSSEVPTARLRAELVVPVLGGRFLSEDGRFELFRPGQGPDGRPAQLMTYSARFVNDGRVFQMSATKYLQSGWRLWGDSTTAHITLTEVGADQDPMRPWRAAGFIKISPRSFLVQLTTMRGLGAGRRASERCRAVQAYAVFFVKGLGRIYLCRPRRN